MYLHANAKLGLAGRFALVKAIEEGMSLKAAAAAFSGSPATAHRWWHRWLDAGVEARATLACLFDRSSRSTPLAAAAGIGARGGNLCLSPSDRVGAEACCRGDRVRALDRLEGAEAGGDLAAAEGGQGGGEPVRVAVPR